MKCILRETLLQMENFQPWLRKQARRISCFSHKTTNIVLRVPFCWLNHLMSSFLGSYLKFELLMFMEIDLVLYNHYSPCIARIIDGRAALKNYREKGILDHSQVWKLIDFPWAHKTRRFVLTRQTFRLCSKLSRKSQIYCKKYYNFKSSSDNRKHKYS